MRATALILFIFSVSGFSLSTNAQVTAVMQAKVKIISGAGFTSINDSFIDLSFSDLSEKEVQAGSFSFVSSPGADVNIHIVDESSITNDKGEKIEFESLTVNRTSSESGEHYVSVNGKVKKKEGLNGHYKGAITAVIEYH